MEMVAGLVLSLLGTGYYLNGDEIKHKKNSECKTGTDSFDTIKEYGVSKADMCSAIGGHKSSRVMQPSDCSYQQSGGGNATSSVSSGSGIRIPVGTTSSVSNGNSFERDILGVLTPEYFDTKNTYSEYKRDNLAYKPDAIFKGFDPEIQKIIRSRIDLGRLRQKKSRFPQVKDGVSGIVNDISKQNQMVPGTFSGIGSGSTVDNGQQGEIPHRVDIDRECDLTHNNMVPFFGSRITQNTDIDNRMAAGKLELYTGNYKLRQQNKKEVKKLFPPIANLTNVYGSRDERDLSRYFPNNTGKRSNELPFEQIRVGRGINQGFTARPSGGYHDQIRILPKRNEELYVNPKTESKGKIIYGKALVDERTTIGNVYKYKPTLLVDNLCGQRNFTTVGEVTAPMVRSGVILKSTDRSKYFTPQITPAISAEASRNTRECLLPRSKISNRQNFLNTPYRNVLQANGKRMNDFSKSGYQNKPNERSVTGPRSFKEAFRSLTRSAKNVIKGWYDKPRYTRKQEYVLHPRPYGNFDTYQPSKGPVYDPNYAARTTIRETTEDNQNMGSISRGTIQNGGGYQTGNWRPRNTQKQFTSDYEYTGIAGAVENKSAKNYDAAYNAELNVNKECIARGRKPTQSNVKLNKGKEYVNIEIKKIEGDEFDTRGKVKDSTIGNRFNPNAISECTLTSFKNTPQEDYHRLDPTLLEPFRRNGLTQSLHSY